MSEKKKQRWCVCDWCGRLSMRVDIDANCVVTAVCDHCHNKWQMPPAMSGTRRRPGHRIKRWRRS